jgi:hypothetical protein
MEAESVIIRHKEQNRHITFVPRRLSYYAHQLSLPAIQSDLLPLSDLAGQI